MNVFLKVSDHGLIISRHKRTWLNSARYTDPFKNGLKERHGQEEYTKGTVFTGYFEKSLKEGEGTLVFTDKSTCKGHFKNDKIKLGYLDAGPRIASLRFTCQNHKKVSENV